MRIVFGLMYMSYGLLKLGVLSSPAVETASLRRLARPERSRAAHSVGTKDAAPGVHRLGRNGCTVFHRGMLPVLNQGVPSSSVLHS